MTRISIVLLQLLRSLSSLGGESSSFLIHSSSASSRTTRTATTSLSRDQRRCDLFHSGRIPVGQPRRRIHIMSSHPDAAASRASSTVAVYFPPIVSTLHPPLNYHNNDIDNDNGEEPNQPWRFEEACQEAIERKVPLLLSQDVVLSQTIHLKGQQALHIVGNRDHHHHDNDDRTHPPQRLQSQQERITISGDLPSLFLLNNKNQLIIENIDLDHTLQTDDHKEVGAAINMRGKSKVVLKHSTVTSVSGFCVWAIQKSNVLLQDCHFKATTRSAIVCFGQTTCQLQNCHMDQAGVHGLCARGTCQISLVDCVITRSAARGIYVYANASLRLQGCHVSGTLHPDKAAVEVSSMGCPTTTTTTPDTNSKPPSFVLKDCQIVDNQGAGVRIRGPIVHEEQGLNLVERNAKGNWDNVREQSDDDSVESNKFPYSGSDAIDQSTTTKGMLPPLRRDAKGSSFRRGDWLCSKCFQIVAAGRPTAEIMVEERCSNCSRPRGSLDEDRLLTMKEILECNMGIDIRQGWTLPSRMDDESATAIVVVWEFDGDDEKGWVPYDAASSSLLEQAYTNMMTQERIDGIDIDNKSSLLVVPEECNQLVDLQGRKYQVNIGTMVQINTETQFPRYVRRRTSANH